MPLDVPEPADLPAFQRRRPGLFDFLRLTRWALAGRPMTQPGCPRCGYPIEGLLGRACPECGADLAAAGVLLPARLSRAWVGVALAAAWSLVAAVSAPVLHELLGRQAAPQVSYATAIYRAEDMRASREAGTGTYLEVSAHARASASHLPGHVDVNELRATRVVLQLVRMDPALPLHRSLGLEVGPDGLIRWWAHAANGNPTTSGYLLEPVSADRIAALMARAEVDDAHHPGAASGEPADVAAALLAAARAPYLRGAPPPPIGPLAADASLATAPTLNFWARPAGWAWGVWAGFLVLVWLIGVALIYRWARGSAARI